jgi:hypothetical protein
MLSASARLPERARLAAAIERHAEAAGQLARVEAAVQKLYDDNIASRTKIAAARRGLSIAAAGRSEILISQALGEPAPDLPDPLECERVLSECERELDDGRKARHLLEAEAQRAKFALDLTEMGLKRAVADVVASDPALAALRAEFERCRLRLSVLIGALLGAGVTTSRVAWGESAFVPAADWVNALVALRTDADGRLPGIPPEDGPDAGSRDGRKAAA